MKIAVFLFLTLLSVLLRTGYSQTDAADGILGKWLSEKKDGQIEIFKENGKFYGRLCWLKNPLREDGSPKTDIHNPDPALQTTPLLNLVILRDFTFKGENTWESGTIYDPTKGKTYSCILTLKSPESLHIRGFIGISLLGKTTEWTKVMEN